MVASIDATADKDIADQSQSPSLRGSGRFGRVRRGWDRLPSRLNPLHCGAVVASRPTRRTAGGQRGVSIPFIAGQWSLRGASSRTAVPGPWSQSPSLRGSGRFERWKSSSCRRCSSQSPSLRGSGRFPHRRTEARAADHRLNPLHCGAVVASRPPADGVRHRPRVSIPFIAGQWSLQKGKEVIIMATERVSIPFIAGQWSLLVIAQCSF